MFGLVELGSWIAEDWLGEGWWGIDLHLVLEAGGRLLAGESIYADPRFLYPPAAAVIGVPLAGLPFDLVSVAYAVAKIALSAYVVLWLTPGWSRPPQAIAILTLVACLPFVHDLFLGNANVMLVLAMAGVALTSDRRWHGVPLGVAAALFAKPFLIPFLLWMLVWRRSALVGTVAAGLAVTAVAAVLAGPASYAEWIEALRAGTRFAAPFEGNHGITALAPGLWAPVAALTAIGLIVVLARRGPLVGLVWAVTAGILLAPYAGTYSALPIAIVIPALAIRAPVLAWSIVAASPIATTHPLPIYAAAILLASLTLREAPADRSLLPRAQPIRATGT